MLAINKLLVETLYKEKEEKITGKRKLQPAITLFFPTSSKKVKDCLLNPFGTIKCPYGYMVRKLRHQQLDTYAHRILSIHVRSRAQARMIEENHANIGMSKPKDERQNTLKQSKQATPRI